MSIVSNFPGSDSGVSTRDNLTTTVSGYALDARQGKVLHDMIVGSSANATLLASGWTGDSAPYTYNLSVTGVTLTSENDLYATLDISTDQLKALQAANIIDGGQSANTIVLKAYGQKPTIDIPIRVYVKGE